MATLNVWLPRFTGPNKGNVGHASLQLDQGSVSYVSWWPDTSTSLTEPASSSFARSSWADDLAAEGGPPDQRLGITCLDERSIASWWDRVSFDGRAIPYRSRFWPETDHYHLYRTNCANLVALAMRIGGGESYAPMPRPLLVMTPHDVLTWGREINSAGRRR